MGCRQQLRGFVWYLGQAHPSPEAGLWLLCTPTGHCHCLQGNFTTKREICMIQLRFLIIRNMPSPPPVTLGGGGLSYKPESISPEVFWAGGLAYPFQKVFSITCAVDLAGCGYCLSQGPIIPLEAFFYEWIFLSSCLLRQEESEQWQTMQKENRFLGRLNIFWIGMLRIWEPLAFLFARCDRILLAFRASPLEN